MQSCADLLHLFYRSVNIPVSLYCREELQSAFMPVALDPDPAARFFQMHGRIIDPCPPVTILGVREIHAGRLHLPSGATIYVGLISSISPTSHLADLLLQDLDLPLRYKQHLHHWLRRAPVISRASFLSVLRLLYRLLTGNDAPAPVDATSDDVHVPEDFHLQSSSDTLHNSADFEKLILSLIEQGRTADLQKALVTYENTVYKAGDIGENPTENLRTIFTVSTALCSRAAIRGGMDYESALTLSDNYIRTMSKMTRPSDILPHLGLMMIAFCREVERLKRPENCSRLTASAISYVLAHLTERIAVADVAEALKTSESHLSHTFRKDMDMTLKTYITRQKMEAAKELLRNTTLSVNVVAFRLGFSSQPHFQKIFLQECGMTPLAYREQGPVASAPTDDTMT